MSTLARRTARAPRALRVPIAACLAAACASAACARTLNIPPPQAVHAAAPPPLEPSRIEVPLSVDVRAALAQLESQVPQVFDTGGRFDMVAGTPVGIRYRAQRTPFRFEARGGALHAETTLALSAEACLGSPIPLPFLGNNACQPVASCGANGEAPRQVQISTDTALRMDPQWRVVAQTQAGPAVFRDRCELTAFHIDVTTLASQLVSGRVAEATRAMDASIAARGDQQPRAQAFWAALQEPMALGDSFWMTLAPRGVRAAPLTLDATSLRTTVGVEVLPHVTAGARPAVEPRPLPQLESADASASAPSGLHITFDAEVTFAEATQLVAQEFRGRSLEVEGHHALVREIRVEGRGGALFFAVDVQFQDGAFSNSTGTIYMTGLPAYDASGGALFVRDLDYTIETRDALLQVADWFMNGSLRQSIARRARWPMAERIERLRRSAEGALSRTLAPGTSLNGHLTAIRPVGAYVSPTGVVVRVVADGTAEIHQELRPDEFQRPPASAAAAPAAAPQPSE